MLPSTQCGQAGISITYLSTPGMQVFKSTNVMPGGSALIIRHVLLKVSFGCCAADRDVMLISLTVFITLITRLLMPLAFTNKIMVINSSAKR